MKFFIKQKINLKFIDKIQDYFLNHTWKIIKMIKILKVWHRRQKQNKM